MLTAERIHGRQVTIEIGDVPGIGWVAVGIVTEGLAHEKGMRFEARADDPSEAGQRLKMEIEAAFGVMGADRGDRDSAYLQGPRGGGPAARRATAVIAGATIRHRGRSARRYRGGSADRRAPPEAARDRPCVQVDGAGRPGAGVRRAGRGRSDHRRSPGGRPSRPGAPRLLPPSRRASKRRSGAASRSTRRTRSPSIYQGLT